MPRSAKFGAVLIGKPVVLGGRIIAARHRDVLKVLQRDLDFWIEPVSATRIDEVRRRSAALRQGFARRRSDAVATLPLAWHLPRLSGLRLLRG